MRNIPGCALLILCSFFFFLKSSAQQPKSYDAQWKKVDDLIQKQGLPKSALDEVKKIYVRAKKDGEQAQVVKALVYMTGLQQENREDNQKQSIAELEKELATSAEPAASILKSLLADIYWQYYQQHRWQLYNRTNTTGRNKTDIATWTTEDFHKKISELYLASLEKDKLLKAKKLDAYEAIIIKGNTRQLRPTLYDLLAHKALTYFKNDERDLKKPSYAFEINSADAFAPVQSFVTKIFSTKDSLSLHHKALLIFQDLIHFHLNDEKPDALIDVDINRIQFVYGHSFSENKKQLYEDALRTIINRYPNEPAAAQAGYLLGAYHEQLASKYDPLKDTSYRYERLKAKRILEETIKNSAVASEGKTNSENLLREINKTSFSYQLEKVNVPEKPFRALLFFKNITSLNFRLVKNEEALQNALQRNYDRYWALLTSAPAVRLWTQALPNTEDLQQHSTEIKIDALPVGEYILLASADEDFSTSSNFLGAGYFHVSNISFVNNGKSFFVANRQTGQPIQKATAEAFTMEYNYKLSRSVKKSIGKFETDKNGFLFLPEKKDAYNNGYYLDIRYNKDRLYLDDPIYQYYYRDTEEDEEDLDDEDAPKKIFFFTDRSIYRPGQTVYFKGIVLQKRKGENKVAAGYENEIFLKDANGNDVDSITITTNEFGSFSGKFQLPQNLLNGEFRIYDLEDENAISISIEEYKRPKFYVEFDKLKQSYKVGDSIAIRGNAKAYAGNFIENAKVSYRVVRQPRFIYPWLFRSKWFPPTQPMEIAHGEISTNTDGQFIITFKALPDLQVSKEWEPVFDYKVYADVTDINGETRSGESLVSAGYKSLLLTMTNPGRTALDSLKSLSITTTNMAGEFVQSVVTVKMTRLLPENRLIRNRYWQQPDLFVLSKEEFVRHFPLDEYGNEADFRDWQKGEIVYQKKDSSHSNTLLSIDDTKLTTGFYEIEVSTTDKDGQEVKNRDVIEIFDPNKNNLTRPEYLWTKSNSIAIEPGQTKIIEIGSSATDVFLVQHIDRLNNELKKPELSYHAINNEKKAFNFTATENDRGGFGINYFFIKDNRLYQFSNVVHVLWNNKNLNVEYASFRDKTQPGSEEKWSVKIKGYKNEKAAAEVLASMYDASLDQFKPHQWNTPDIWPYYTQLLSWNGMQNFTASSSQLHDFYRINYQHFDKRYDQLNFSLYHISQQARRFERETSRVRAQTNDTSLAHLLQGKAAGLDMQAAAPAALEEVVVTGYGMQRKAAVTGAIAVRGINTTHPNALYVVDGVVLSSNPNLSPQEIANISVLSGAEATALYGSRGINGLIIISTKKGAEKPKEIVPRKNFNETAFFFPELKTDKEGNIEFSFTTPEALTRWKLQTLAHTKDLAFGLSSKEMVTQKELMVQPNLPRFLREGDRIELSVKIANLSDKELTGQAELQLVDATNNQSVDGWFQNVFPNQYFTVPANSSEVVKFPIQVPYNFNKALVWRIVARSGNYSDGEEAALPVLTNKMLVTETMPLPMKGAGSKSFVFEKLLKTNSESLQHHALTVEYTSNPAWYAVQALPYLMEFPYECAEQTWNRYYANALATKIVTAAPRIKQIFEQWQTKDTSALFSNLQKNEELKSVLLQETPWVLEAKTEAQQKKNIALLFDAVRMGREQKKAFEQLKTMQSENGGFVWFKGGPDDRYITQYIITGIGHLKKLGAVGADHQDEIASILRLALPYLDKKIKEDYDNMIKYKADLKKQQISHLQTQYLYMRSFFPEQPIQQASQTAYNYFKQQAKEFWVKNNKYSQGMIALALHRSGDAATSGAILKSLKESSITNDELGTYWKDNSFGYSWHWSYAPIETQALLIEAFAEIGKDTRTVDDLRTWLLKNKQTNNWHTTKATADACYALLLQGTNWLINEPEVTVQLGATSIGNTQEKQQAGTGYFKRTIESGFVKPEMGNITVSVKNSSANSSSSQPAASWGAVYWQYFEDLDKITTASTPLKLDKKLFIEKNSDRGPVLTPIEEGTEVKVGDKIKVRIELRVDRDMEYVHMKDLRSSGTEPVNVLSGYKWQGGLGYYETTKDASTNFFFNHLPKGTYVFEYPIFVTHAGNFSNGITNIQCMYAPEFSAHSEGVRLTAAQ